MYDEQEFKEHSLSAELAALERQLTGLTPMAPSIDRDRLMYSAGRASVGRAAGPSWAGSKLWPTATALATAASVVLATMLVWQRDKERVAAAPPAAEMDDVAPIVAQSDLWRWSDRRQSGYLGVRQVALTRGGGALEYRLPAPGDDESDESPPPATARQLLKELLPTSSHVSS
ncbi:MAG: hypothetical protein WD971_03835 [Pirellulales bacterium]